MGTKLTQTRSQSSLLGGRPPIKQLCSVWMTLTNSLHRRSCHPLCRHLEQNSLVPALWIRFIVAVLYDCNLDVLLISHQVPWVNVDNQKLAQPGILFLWLHLHHQLQETASISSAPGAGLRNIFEGSHALGLSSYNVHEWPQQG